MAWKILDACPPDLRVDLKENTDSADPGCGTAPDRNREYSHSCTVKANGSGKALIRVYDPLFPACFDEKVIEFGCGGCASGKCGPGDGTPDENTCQLKPVRRRTCQDPEGGSADTERTMGRNAAAFAFGMGQGIDGKKLPPLRLAVGEPGPLVASPIALSIGVSFGSSAGPVHVVQDSATKVIRQVKAPEVLADVTLHPSGNGYYVSFYATPTNGWGTFNTVYDVSTSTPLATWLVEAPNAPSDYNVLTISKLNSSSQVEYCHRYTSVGGVWQHELATSPQAEGALRSTTESWTDNQDGTWSRARYFYEDEALHAFTVDTIQVLTDGSQRVLQSQDGSGTIYYTYDSAGRIESVRTPDGGWTWHRYDYPATGDYAVIRGWKDQGYPTAAPEPNSAGVTATVTTYDAHLRPTCVLEYVNGTLVAKTVYSNSYHASDRIQGVTEQRLVAPPDVSGALTTITAFQDDADSKVLNRTDPDSRRDEYTYTSRTFAWQDASLGTFTFTGAGSDVLESVLHTVVSGPTGGVPNRSTIDETYKDYLGRVVLQRQLVCGQTQSLRWTAYVYAGIGATQSVTTYHSDGTRTYSGGCCSQRVNIGADGVREVTQYDVLGRVTSVQRDAMPSTATSDNIPVGAQTARTTSYEYLSASGNRYMTRVTTTSGELTDTRETVYDLAGRVCMETTGSGTGQLRDLYEYGAFIPGTARRKVTVYRAYPATATQGTAGVRDEITEYYRDGQVYKISGEGAVGRLYDYGVDTGSPPLRWTKVTTNPDVTPARDQITRYDPLGRVVEESRPAYGTTTARIVTRSEYWSASADAGHVGHLKKQQTYQDTTPLGAATWTTYDAFGHVALNGLDLDAAAGLQTGGTDRVTRTDTYYGDPETRGGLWQVTDTFSYPTDNDSTEKRINRTMRQVGGFTTPVVARTETIDAAGVSTVNEQHRTVFQTITAIGSEIARDCTYVTSQTVRPGSGTSKSLTYVGLLQGTLSPSGPRAAYGYDALGRNTSVTDGRNNTMQTNYDASGRVTWTRDGANNQTTYEYYAATDTSAGAYGGRIKYSYNALSKATYFAYTMRGEIDHVWGDTPQPIWYEYDNYGQRTKMHTYRASPGAWSGTAWPDGDVTSWTFAPATGLLTRKTDASGKYVDYKYTADGRLYQRIWARHASSQAATTYTHDPQTGELTDVAYDTGTTDTSYPMTNVHYTYDRLGRVATLTDAAGTHTFGYNAHLQPETEAITGTFYGTTVTLHQDYQATAPYRFSSLRVTRDPNSEEVYGATYMYENEKPTPANTGRLWRVTGPGLPDYGAEYSYATGSDLVGEVQFKHDANTIIARTTRTYEPNRDLLGKVANTWQSDSRNISTYDHFQPGSTTVAADALGRRTSLAQTGEVFPSPFTKAFGYNDRNELTNAYTIETDTVFSYAYDSIGNRTNASWWSGTEPPYSASTTYMTNNLNQYRELIDGQSETPPYLGYDDDGNLTRETAAGRLDVNCDGVADFRDVTILQNLASSGICKPTACPAWYTAQYPWCDCYWADVSGDNCLNNADRTRYSQYLNSDYAVMLYTWDGENRLRAVTNKEPYAGSPKEEYKYDALGRRIERKVFWWNGSSWSLFSHQKYVWSGWKLLLELSVPTTGAPTVARKHTWGLDLAGLNGAVNSLEGAGTIGGLLSVADAARTDDRIVYFYDANGNVTEVLNLKYMGGFAWDSARLLAHYEYDPYGNRTNAIPAGEYNQPWRFSTKQFSTYTGLGYWGYRYYSPRLGRWISNDPMEELGSANLCAAVRDNPLLWIDPDGGTEQPIQPGAAPGNSPPSSQPTTQPAEDRTKACCMYDERRTATTMGEYGVSFESTFETKCMKSESCPKGATSPKECCKSCRSEEFHDTSGSSTRERTFSTATWGECCSCRMTISRQPISLNIWQPHAQLTLVCPKFRLTVDKGKDGVIHRVNIPVMQDIISYDTHISCAEGDRLLETLKAVYPGAFGGEGASKEWRFIIGYECHEFARRWAGRTSERTCHD